MTTTNAGYHNLEGEKEIKPSKGKWLMFGNMSQWQNEKYYIDTVKGVVKIGQIGLGIPKISFTLLDFYEFAIGWIERHVEEDIWSPSCVLCLCG